MHSVGLSEKELLLMVGPKETYETLQPPSNRYSINSFSSYTSIIDENGYFIFLEFLSDIILKYFFDSFLDFLFKI